METEEPSLAIDLTLKLDPRTTESRTDIEEAIDAIPYNDIFDPSLLNERRLNEDPRPIVSNADSIDPKLLTP